MALENWMYSIRGILLVEFFNVGFYCLIISRVNCYGYIRVFF